MSLVLRNVAPYGESAVDIVVSDGVIVEITAVGQGSGYEVIEFHGEVALPGLVDLHTLCRRLPHVQLDATGTRHARHGRGIPLVHVAGASPSEEGPLVALDDQGAPLAIVERSGDGLRVLRGFHFA